MTVKERIATIVANGWPIAYDGCHKLYFLTDEKSVEEARSSGYDTHPSHELPRLYEMSCVLRFISPWDLTSHACYVKQFEFDEEEEE